VSGGGHWGGGMFISAHDQARFGLLTLRRGQWRDRQILSDRWVTMALTPTPVQDDYGFMNWFLNTGKKRWPSAPESTFCHLGNGTNMTISNSVAVGVKGESFSESSGFIWPEDAGAVWLFEDNIAHNNLSNGVFVWQNNSESHPVDGLVAYYNGKAGIEHGAYENSYQYADLTLLENGVAIISHALGDESDGGEADTQTWTNIVSNGAALFIDEHATAPEVPVRFLDCDFGQVVVADGDGAEPSEYDFVNCGLEPEDFDLSSAYATSVFRVQNEDGTAYQLEGDGTVTEIAPFYD